MISSEIIRRKRKLEAFEGFIKQLLQDSPFLSAAQIYDRLKEHFPELSEVSECTVYNTVRLVRDREGLPKVQECGRQMSKAPDCEYGEKAQVDFGEKVLRTDLARFKVHAIATKSIRALDWLHIYDLFLISQFTSQSLRQACVVKPTCNGFLCGTLTPADEVVIEVAFCFRT